MTVANGIWMAYILNCFFVEQECIQMYIRKLLIEIVINFSACSEVMWLSVNCNVMYVML